MTAIDDPIRKDNHELKMTMSDILYLADNPTYNPLEVGFRHSPLSQKEINHRLIGTLYDIIDLATIAIDGRPRDP